MSLDHRNEYHVKLELPYPAIEPESRRLDDAYAMLRNVGGDQSEMSTVSLYCYNSVILNPNYADIARCFHEISIVEMQHLNIFASLAFQMGLDPRLWSMQKRGKFYWTPAFNRYPRNIREVLENSIKGEEAAIQNYTRQAETIQDTNIVDILHRVMLDEQRHIEIFHTILDELP